MKTTKRKIVFSSLIIILSLITLILAIAISYKLYGGANVPITSMTMDEIALQITLFCVACISLTTLIFITADVVSDFLLSFTYKIRESSSPK